MKKFSIVCYFVLIAFAAAKVISLCFKLPFETSLLFLILGYLGEVYASNIDNNKN